MQQDFRDNLFRAFLAVNALLREEAQHVRRLLEARDVEAKHNPNWRLQPRAPRGVPEGGQWVDSGGGSPKQLQPRTRPLTRPAPSRRPQTPHRRELQPSRRSPPQRPTTAGQVGRLQLPTRSHPGLTTLPLRLFRLSPITLSTLLAGDTPQPVVTTRLVPGTTDLLLVDYNNEPLGQRFADFQRVITPEQTVHLTLLGVDTGIPTVRPAEVEHLYVDVTIEGDQVRFSRHELAIAYGREIPGIASFEDPPDQRPFVIVPITREERRLAFNLRTFGATNTEISIALQQLRTRESDGDPFVAALREAGADRRRIAQILSELEIARRDRPYTPPRSGPLLDVFPGLATAPGKTRVYPREGWVDSIPPAVAADESSARAIAGALENEIRTIDPNYLPPTLGDDVNFPTSGEGRTAYIDTLMLERAATIFKVREELQPLQVETFRFLQQRADIAYDEGARLYEAGELEGRGRENAIGNYVDRTLDQELRDLYESLGISIEGDLVRVHRGENLTYLRYRIPDARVGDIYFDISLEEKTPGHEQIVDYFNTMSKPRYVVIVRPRQRGRSYIITPPRGRYSRG